MHGAPVLDVIYKREMYILLLLGFIIAQARFVRHNMTRSYHSRAGCCILIGFMRTGDGSWSFVLGTTLFAACTDRLVAFQSFCSCSDLELHLVSLRAELMVLYCGFIKL